MGERAAIEGRTRRKDPENARQERERQEREAVRELNRVLIGCSGWNYAHWRNGVFYPARLPRRDWLPFYAERFDTVEVNTTFYRLPTEAMVGGWAARTPHGFVAAAKASRYLTHVKRLLELPEHLDLLLGRLRPLAGSGKLGPLLWQLPPTFHRDLDRLGQALAGLPEAYSHAFEFRHESWFEEETFELLRAHGVALVVADRAGAPGLLRTALTAPFTYVRFHRGHGDGGNYTPSELDRWAERLAGFGEQVDVYAYFNNDQQGFAIENALRLRSVLGLVAAD